MTPFSRFCSLLLSIYIICNNAYQAPCDIFALDRVPCVAAHSTVRALYAKFDGPLYQIKRHSDNKTMNIATVSIGGISDAVSQNKFCAGTDCIISRIYDQSPEMNHLDIAPKGGFVHHPDRPVNASRLSIQIDGNPVYGAYFEGAMGYRNDNTSGVATGNDAETIYMVVSGKHYNGGCCFDYGNAETDNNDDGKSTMEAIYFGNSTGVLTHPGAGKGPWIMADLENGAWAGRNESLNPSNVPIIAEFVFAMLKGGGGGFALKGGDANRKDTDSLKVLYYGPRPPRYQPMHKQGAIILGIGGDNSDSGIGTFFEGAMTKGLSSEPADNAVFGNVVAANYGK